MWSNIKILVWMKMFIPLVVTLLLLGCGPEVSDQQMVQAAKAYLDQNKLREAALELKNALQGNPDNGEARYLLGMLNLDMGDTASAEKEFRRAIETGWQEGRSRVGHVRAMINRKAFRKVVDEVNIDEGYPDDVRADLHALLALAQAGLGEISQAIKTLDNAIAIDADAFHVLKSAIQIYMNNDDMELAADSLERGLELYGEKQEILLLSAAMATRGKKNAEAEDAYKKIIEQDPEKLVTVYGRQARLGLARFEVLSKELDKAQATLTPLLKQGAGDPEVNFVAGLLAFEQGELDLAEERLLAVLKVVPEHAQTQLLFGTVSYAQNDYEQAAYYIAKYVSDMPDNMNARKLLGRTYIKLGQHDEAKAALQPGLEDSGEDAELLALVGLSQLQGGNITSGIEGLEEAVKAAPESSTLRSELARAYISAGDTESAIKELNAILAEGGDKKQTEALLISAHIKAGKNAQAIGIVLDMLQETPEDPAVLSLAGNVFVMSNDKAEARKYFNKALQFKPDYVPASMLLARLEEIEGNVSNAEVLYKKLANTNKESIAPLMALARLAETQNQMGKMIKWLKKVNKRAPQDIGARKILIEYYLRIGKLDKAGLLIKEAIKIDSRDKTLLVQQARWFMENEQHNNALSSLSELVTRVPDSISVRTMLGEVYLNLGQIPDAQRQLNIVLEKQPYYVPALVLMTGLELHTTNYVKALASAEKIQKVQPEFYLGYELAGDASMIKKDYLAAKNNYEHALKLKQFSELIIKLSEVSTRTGKFEEATKILLTWLGDHPDEARVLQFLGATYQKRKQNKEAIEAYNKVLILQPDNLVSLNNLAWLYTLTNDSKALDLAERAHKKSPNDAGVKDTYGWALVQQGQADKGRRILAQAMRALPEVPEVKYHYAIALLKLDEGTEARKILGKLIESGEAFEGRGDAQKLIK